MYTWFAETYNAHIFFWPLGCAMSSQIGSLKASFHYPEGNEGSKQEVRQSLHNQNRKRIAPLFSQVAAKQYGCKVFAVNITSSGNGK